MQIPDQPWLFGDEYLYLNKARNLSHNIDVITDATQGHKYPPLYSYLISLAINDDPVASYRRVQLINVFSSQLLLLASFYFLNKAFRITSKKHGKIFLIFAYLATATLSSIVGFYPVAMSENLFLPLTLLVFSVGAYLLKKKQTPKIWEYLSLGVLVSLCILTRTIAVVMIPAVLVSFVIKTLQTAGPIKRKRLIKLIQVSLLLTAASLIPVFLFNWIESLFVQNAIQASTTKDYSSFMPGYSKTFYNLVTLQSSLFDTAKILGNSVIYFVMSTFFIPVLFLVESSIKQIKSKKLDPTFWFVGIYTFLTLGVSFLHSYGGFQNAPIRYSTYFRYLDSATVILFVYGLMKLWQRGSQKHEKRLSKGLLAISLLASLFLSLMLPIRDFYLTINSLGWGWLDLLLSTSITVKIAVSLIGIMVVWLVTTKPKLTVWLTAPIVVINLLTVPVQLKMHNWLADDSQGQLQQPVLAFAEQNPGAIYYFNPELLSIGEKGSIYYIKYLLMFHTNQVVPMREVVPDSLQELDNTHSNPIIYLDSLNAESQIISRAEEEETLGQKQLDENLFFIKRE